MGSQKQKRKARAIPTDADNQQSTVSVSSPSVFTKLVDRDGYNDRALTRFTVAALYVVVGKMQASRWLKQRWAVLDKQH